MAPEVALRRLDRRDLLLVAEIDRSERIDVLYNQHGTELVERHGRWTASPWDAEGDADHSVAAKVRELERYEDDGGIALGAFAPTGLVAIGVVVPHVRPTIAQMAFLHVSAPSRATGVGTGLLARLEDIARSAGDAQMVVSATPSLNTVRFYRRRGFEPSAEPPPELVALEPEDVQMHKWL